MSTRLKSVLVVIPISFVTLAWSGDEDVTAVGSTFTGEILTLL